MSGKRETERAREWLATQSSCIGYPKCDGDLEGNDHDAECPLHGQNRAGRSRPPLDAMLVAYADHRLREELTALALRCEANFKDCDKANVSCHMIDAEAIRARLRTLESEEKEQ